MQDVLTLSSMCETRKDCSEEVKIVIARTNYSGRAACTLLIKIISFFPPDSVSKYQPVRKRSISDIYIIVKKGNKVKS